MTTVYEDILRAFDSKTVDTLSAFEIASLAQRPVPSVRREVVRLVELGILVVARSKHKRSRGRPELLYRLG